nr:probable inactive heme oxygenase 2, chloroplastic isoform X2 [Erigeron canadensis]
MKTNMTSATVNLPTFRPPSMFLARNIFFPTPTISINNKNNIKSSIICNCLNPTTTTDDVSAAAKELPPPVKQKRKVYRRMRPGETKGITEEMRFVAMKLRDKKLKLKTDNMKQKNKNENSEDNEEEEKENGSENSESEDDGETDDDVSWEPELDGFMRYLVDSRFIFTTIERLVDESQDVSFAYFRNTGLERSESFTKDIDLLSEQLTIPEPLFTSKKYVKYLEDLAAESPPLFFCHLYNIYFSHMAGGQVIARKVSEKLLEGRELAICQWPGDPEELLKGMRDKLNALGQHWTRDEKNRCLKETSKCFMYMGTIIRLIIMR